MSMLRLMLLLTCLSSFMKCLTWQRRVGTISCIYTMYRNSCATRWLFSLSSLRPSSTKLSSPTSSSSPSPTTTFASVSPSTSSIPKSSPLCNKKPKTPMINSKPNSNNSAISFSTNSPSISESQSKNYSKSRFSSNSMSKNFAILSNKPLKMSKSPLFTQSLSNDSTKRFSLQSARAFCVSFKKNSLLKKNPMYSSINQGQQNPRYSRFYLIRFSLNC